MSALCILVMTIASSIQYSLHWEEIEPGMTRMQVEEICGKSDESEVMTRLYKNEEHFCYVYGWPSSWYMYIQYYEDRPLVQRVAINSHLSPLGSLYMTCKYRLRMKYGFHLQYEDWKDSIHYIKPLEE